MQTGKDKKIEIRCTEEFKERVRSAAEKDNRSMSNYIEHTLLEAVEKSEKAKKKS